MKTVGLLSGVAALAVLCVLQTVPVGAQTAEELIQAQHVMIRHRLEPDKPVYVGQPVRLWIEVMTRTWFLEAPKYPETIEVRDGIVIPPDAFGVNSTERIGSDTYAVQGRSYTIFPQRTGQFEVPPIPITLVVARDDASKSPPLQLSTPPLTIEARMPSEAEGHGLVLSTPRLTVSEEYSRATVDLKVGESFDRRVTVTIEDSVAMLLPPMSFTAGDGVAVYPGRPDISDKRNRGQLSGTRIDQATFVMEAEGNYELPATSIWWWNLRTSQLVEEVLPAVVFTVGPNPDLAAEHLGEPEVAEEVDAESAPVEDEPSWSWRQVGLLAIGLMVAIFAARRLRRRWASGKQGREARNLEGELFELFRMDAKSGDPEATYSALMTWLDQASAVGRTMTAREFVANSGDAELSQLYEALEQTLFAATSSRGWSSVSGGAFADSVGRARKRWMDGGSGHSAAREPLPPLNPGM